jgi:hypothetical protein
VSFDIAALSAARKLDASEARHVYGARCAGRPWEDLLAADPRMEAFYAELTSRWPELSAFAQDDEAMEGSPWATDPEHSPGFVIVRVRWPWAREVEVAFCAMAMRHGVYVYDPQTTTLYDPTEPADRDHWSAEEAERRATLETAAATSRWKAKGGRALAEEVTGKVVAPAVGGLQPVPHEELRYTFPVSDEVEGRARFGASPAGGRELKVEARVGIYHRALEQAMTSLWGAGEFSTLERYTSLGYLDADDVDPGALQEMVARVHRLMGWADRIDCLDKVLDAMHHKGNGGWRAVLGPVALQLAGRSEEAAASLQRIVLATWEDDCRTGAKAETEAFVQRFNQAYDPIYKDQAGPVIADLVAAGAGVSSLSDLRDRAGGKERAVSVLGQWLATSSYVPLKRDLACLLGSTWAKPTAASFLVEEFRRRADDRPPEPTLLFAIGEAFSSVVDETSLDDAVSIATNDAFGPYRRPFSEAIGKMVPAFPRLVPVLLQLVQDPQAVAPGVLGAVSELDLVQALPSVEKLVGHRHIRVHQAAISTVARLRRSQGELVPPTSPKK